MHEIDNVSLAIEIQNSCQPQDSCPLVHAYFNRISSGDLPQDVIKDIWLEYYRSATSSDKTKAIVHELLGTLPRNVQAKLDEPIYRHGSIASLIILAREEAEQQVRKERSAKFLETQKKLAEKQPEQRKKPSKGMATHIRREKARIRREQKK